MSVSLFLMYTRSMVCLYRNVSPLRWRKVMRSRIQRKME